MIFIYETLSQPLDVCVCLCFDAELVTKLSPRIYLLNMNTFVMVWDTVVAETVITGEWFIASPATGGPVTGSCVFSRQWIVAVVS